LYSIDLYWPMSLAVGTTDAALVLVLVLVLVVVDDDGWKLARAWRSAAPGPAGCGGDGKEEDEEEDAAAEKDDAAEEAEEDEGEEPAMDTSALSKASDITWSNDGSIGSLSGITLISLSDITPKSWPGKVPLVVVLADVP
jgi:hypothetical protein